MTDLITRTRCFLVAVGLLSLAAGAILLVIPGRVITWPWANDILLIAFFTIVVVVASLLGPFVFFEGEPGDEDLRAPEWTPSTPAPGDDLERLLDHWSLLPVSPTRRDRIRNRLRRAAIQTIIRTTSCSSTVAQERLEQGIWTDDPAAAAFVQAQPDPTRSVLSWIRFPHRARRAAQAILDRAEEGEDRR